MIEKNEKMEKQQLPFINRELSWMDFNARVLEEAFEKENPVMERIRFLSITASNLDEFFMVRVAGVKEQVESGYNRADFSGLTPAKLLPQLNTKIYGFTERQYSCLHRSIVPALKKNGIMFVTPDQMSEKQTAFISDYFDTVLFPVLTPLAVDRSRPFPFLANKSLNLAVRLKSKKSEESYFAVVQVPGILSRFLEVPSEEGRVFVLLEDVITYKLESLFELNEIQASCPFRITRDSDLEIDEEADDLLSEIVKSIKRRKRGKPVRLELLQRCDKETKEFLIEMLEIHKSEIYEVPGPLDLTFLSKFANLSGCEHLCFKPIKPVYPPAAFWGYSDMFEAIRDKDRMVHHPYESFECVVDFVRQAAEDENVLAIKQTLYRVSGHSPIVAALLRAAEENNILWAKKLEEAGCHVIYGLAGLKTHCKILLVVRRDEDGIRRYLHMATGNYNDSTAKIYTDIGVFTCKEPFGRDASSLFNVLTGYSLPPDYNKFAVAPHGLREFFVRMIQKEIANAQAGLPCGITAKVNSLVDPEIIELLYQASQANVPIRLIVRGICCLVPGLPGVSENITVISIVGQLLEHSRIFKFENAGNPKIYMGSADWMPRNLDRRIELVFPIEDEDLKERAFGILETMWNDNINARMLRSDTTYEHIDRRGKAPHNSQVEFSIMAQKAVKALQVPDASQPYKPIRSTAE